MVCGIKCCIVYTIESRTVSWSHELFSVYVYRCMHTLWCGIKCCIVSGALFSSALLSSVLYSV